MDPFPTFDHERALGARVAGVDEAGRGPLAGPVFAAAVILNPDAIPPGIHDSKQLTAARRAALAPLICASAIWFVAKASVAEIDRLNIHHATHLAMCRAVAGLTERPQAALIDGNRVPRDLSCPAVALVRGDTLSLSVAAASILAKEWRDRYMVALAQQHPGYGWNTNMGYPTAQHRAALERLGVTPHHRRSFAPVHKILYQGLFASA